MELKGCHGINRTIYLRRRKLECLVYGPGGDIVEAQDSPGDFDPRAWIGVSSSDPTITLSTSTLTGFTYVVGSGPSVEQTFTISGSKSMANISIAASTNYEISGSNFGFRIYYTHSAYTKRWFCWPNYNLCSIKSRIKCGRL